MEPRLHLMSHLLFSQQGVDYEQEFLVLVLEFHPQLMSLLLFSQQGVDYEQEF